MKKIMMILAALVLLLSAAYAEENDLLARIRQKGEIVVATEGAWAPWTYHDENDNWSALMWKWRRRRGEAGRDGKVCGDRVGWHFRGAGRGPL